MDRNDAIAGADNSLLVIYHLLEGLREAGPRPSQTIEAAICLADMIGQKDILVGELGSADRIVRSGLRRPYGVVKRNSGKV